MPPGSVADKLNRLESAITSAEDSAEDARWAQAEEVARLLDEGNKPGEVAAVWVNGRTEKPYARQHVMFCKRVWDRWGVSELTQRPDWTTAYYTAQQRSDEIVEPEERKQQWSDAHESRAPTTVETARKLADNLVKKAPEAVKDEIRRSLNEDAQGKYVTPATRKAREAQADEDLQPIKNAVIGGFGQIEAVSLLMQYIDVVKEMVEERALDADRMRAIDEAFELARQETEVARAVVGLEA